MEKKVRVLIVEDEFITMDTLRDYLENAGYEVSGDAMRASEAIAVLERGDTDLVMLDIHLKGAHDGIWLADYIRNHYQIPFIFLSAYSDVETVKRAAQTHPQGYLVKPFAQADVFSAIEVALTNHTKEQNPLGLPEAKAPEEHDWLINQSLFVKDNLSYKKVNLADIRSVQAYKNYIELHLGAHKLVIRSTLQRFGAALPPTLFMQVHRSFYINLKFVEEIDTLAVTVAGQRIPLTKTHRDELLKRFQLFA